MVQRWTTLCWTISAISSVIVIFDNFGPLLLLSFTDKRSFLRMFLKCSYFMIHTLSFVIQQPLFSVQPSWIFYKLKVQGGLDNVAGKSGAGELNSWLLIGIYLYKSLTANKGFIQINPSTEGFLTNKPKNDKIMEINSHKSSHCN